MEKDGKLFNSFMSIFMNIIGAIGIFYFYQGSPSFWYMEINKYIIMFYFSINVLAILLTSFILFLPNTIEYEFLLRDLGKKFDCDFFIKNAGSFLQISYLFMFFIFVSIVLKNDLSQYFYLIEISIITLYFSKILNLMIIKKFT